MSLSTTERLIHAFVTSRLDNCNSVLHGLPNYVINRLQLVQNAAARLVVLSSKHDHVSPILADLHWLPIHFRIQFKILLLTFKALHGLAPVYLQDLLSKKSSSRNLRSSSQLLLQTKSFNMKTYGLRSFSVAAPLLWNSLPSDIRDIHQLSSFKSALKTYLYNLAYNP